MKILILNYKNTIISYFTLRIFIMCVLKHLIVEFEGWLHFLYSSWWFWKLTYSTFVCDVVECKIVFWKTLEHWLWTSSFCLDLLADLLCTDFVFNQLNNLEGWLRNWRRIIWNGIKINMKLTSWSILPWWRNVDFHEALVV